MQEKAVVTGKSNMIGNWIICIIYSILALATGLAGGTLVYVGYQNERWSSVFCMTVMSSIGTVSFLVDSYEYFKKNK